jgi:hypothetical protein
LRVGQTIAASEVVGVNLMGVEEVTGREEAS